ncbi:MAG TPA: hypothetical protein VMV35_06655 [Halothiobacillus sp.]|nr:hypothetical protein [Halothiobacillus sp.]
MKYTIIFLLMIGGGYYGWQHYQHSQDEKANPDVITHPDYATLRMNVVFPNRTVDGTLFVKTVDPADCQRNIQLLKDEAAHKLFAMCPQCEVQTAECVPQLPPREAILFENKPTAVTYYSLARGDRHEREMRIIYWGVTDAESDKLCNGMLMTPMNGRRGAATCIRYNKND